MKLFATLVLCAALVQGARLSDSLEQSTNMTLEKAMEELPGMPAQLRSFIQKGVGKRNAFLQTDPQETADAAKVMINGMLEEAEEKLENTTENCKNSIATLKSMISAANTGMATIRATLSMAVASKSYNGQEMQKLLTETPILREASRTYGETCEEDKRAFREGISVLTNDSAVLSSIMATIDCNTNTLMLMHCRANHSREQSTVAFANRSLHDQVGRLHSRKIAKRVHRVLKNSYRLARGRSFVQIGGEPSAGNTSGCSIADSPSCPLIVDKFQVIFGGLQDKLVDTQRKLQQRSGECTMRLAYDESMIEEKTTRLGEHTAKMGDAEAQIVSSREEEETMQERLDNLNAQLRKQEAYCHDEKKKFTSEACALNKIRDELFSMSGLTPEFVQDCVVSEWVVATSCTATCGGGTETHKREVVTRSEGGAACPPLTKVVSCNMNPCPVDCVMGDWAGWGACTAMCGGGVQERNREILTRAEYGGAACGETTEGIECNIQACAVPCTLADWTPWSTCTKACGKGLQLRQRHVQSEAQNGGACPAPKDSWRLNFRDCNDYACPSTVTCNQSVDVAFIVDSSGTVGTSGWEYSKAAVKAILSAFVDNTEAAVITYGGPEMHTNWEQYESCVLGAGSSYKLSTDCGISILSEFTNDTDAVKELVDGAQWVGTTTFTSGALTVAGNLFQRSRVDAKKVAILITDGGPISSKKTLSAASKLRDQGVTVVAVLIGKTRTVVNEVSKLVSWPTSQHFISLEDYSELPDEATVNAIMESTCPAADA